jgi:hypothetical protein
VFVNWCALWLDLYARAYMYALTAYPCQRYRSTANDRLIGVAPSMQGEMRVMLGRLLQRMEQRHRLHEADISLVREVVAQLDASGEVTRPPTRQMIVDALRNEPGLSRQEIVAAIRRDYGIEVPPNTITGTLRRMETDGMVRHRGQRWFL